MTSIIQLLRHLPPVGGRGRTALLLVGAGLLTWAPAAAQDPQEEMELVFPGDSVVHVPPLPPKTDRPRPRPRLWSTEATLSGAVDSNVDRDDDEVTAPGVEFGVTAGVRNRARRPTLLADYRYTAHTFSYTDRWDRNTHRIRVTHRLRLSDQWSVETLAAAQTGLMTVEYRKTDQLMLMPRLQFQPSREHRVRVHGMYRARRYQDETRSTAISPSAAIDYRYRWGGWHYADVTYRHEQNRAELDRRRYTRVTYTGSYTRPLGASMRMRLRVDHRDVDYEIRTVAGPAGTMLREDISWIPSVHLTHEFNQPLRLDLGYRWMRRTSNDPGAEYDSHRAAITLRYRW
jgi:hypothetical protein